MLFIICGLQGTGKTTVARTLSSMTDSTILRTDVIRKEIFKKPEYSDQEMQRVYNEMFSRARKLINDRKNVVLDATFNKEEYRKKQKNYQKTQT